MKLNGITKLNEGDGDYIVIEYNGSDNYTISHQCKTVDEAINWTLSNHSGTHAIAKIVTVHLGEAPFI